MGTIGGATAGSWLYGYVFGKPLRHGAAYTAASIGFTFGCFLVLQNTRERFLGRKENALEARKFGVHPDQPAADALNRNRRNPEATGFISEEAKRSFSNWKNY